MKLKIFSVRDRATVQFGSPMFLVSEGQAIRSFSDEVNRPSGAEGQNQLYQHSEDFDLYFCGEWDSETGVFSCEVPVQVVTGKQVKTGSN